MPTTPAQFAALAKEFQEKSHGIMLGKRAEYSPHEGDVLQNFRQVGSFQGVKPSEVCIQYMLKHVQSLLEAARSGAFHWDYYKPDGTEGLKSRVVDVMNYTLLLAACLAEENAARKAIQVLPPSIRIDNEQE